MLTPLANLAQTYTYNYTTGPSASAGISPIFWIVYLAVVVIMIISMWKLYTKAGKPGWASIVPIYNVIVLLEIIGKPIWWILLFLVPFVNVVIEFIVVLELAKRFGKDAGYAILLFFLPFIGFPLLTFGNSQYNGGGAAPAGAQPYAPGPQPGPQPTPDAVVQPQPESQPDQTFAPTPESTPVAPEQPTVQPQPPVTPPTQPTVVEPSPAPTDQNPPQQTPPTNLVQ